MSKTEDDKEKITHSKEYIDEICQEICENYCKFPDIWDEEKEGIPLNESDTCKFCPLSDL